MSLRHTARSQSLAPAAASHLCIPCAQVSVFFFQGRGVWVIYGLLSASQRLLLGKSRRGAITSLFRPDPMVSGAERAQFEARFLSSILLKRASLGFLLDASPSWTWTGLPRGLS